MAGGSWSAAQIKRAAISETTAASNEIVAATAGRIIRVLAFSLTTTLLNDLTWQTAAAALTGAIRLGTNGTLVANFVDEGHFETVAGEALNLLSSVATAHGGWVNYVEI